MPNARFRKRCAHCGQVAAMGSRDQRYCSNRCSLLGRGRDWWLEHNRKICEARRARGYSARARTLRAAGLDDTQIALVRKMLESVRVASHQAGKRRGWAEALGEHDDRGRVA